MLAIIWICSLLLMLGIYVKRPSLVYLYMLSWGLLVSNYYFGPLSYPQAKISSSAVVIFSLPILFFLLGYWTANVLINGRLAMTSDLRVANELVINKIGSLFAVSWVVGGLIYAIPFIASLDLHGLRISFVEGDKSVSIFSQLGSIFSGLAWFMVARIAMNRGAFSLTSARITVFSLLLIPIFMAGRQIYFQLIVMLLIGFIVSRNYAIKNPPKLLDASRLMKQTALMAILLISTVTVIRFAGESLVYENKLEQFNMISNANLSSGYSGMYDTLPNWVADIVIEFDYYFSAQLVHFLERFSAIDAPILDMHILEKSPFLKNNINKFCSIAGFSCFEKSNISYVGSISDSAWGTVFSTNFRLFGIVGTLLVTSLFGAICSISQCAFSSSPNNFVAWNFFLANSVVAFYSIMDSIFSEIYFLVYYTLAFLLFVSSTGLRLKTGRAYTAKRVVS